MTRHGRLTHARVSDVFVTNSNTRTPVQVRYSTLRVPYCTVPERAYAVLVLLHHELLSIGGVETQSCLKRINNFMLSWRGCSRRADPCLIYLRYGGYFRTMNNVCCETSLATCSRTKSNSSLLHHSLYFIDISVILVQTLLKHA